MGALGTHRVQEGQEGPEGQFVFCPFFQESAGAEEKGQEGRTPYRGVPIGPLAPMGLAEGWGGAESNPFPSGKAARCAA